VQAKGTPAPDKPPQPPRRLSKAIVTPPIVEDNAPEIDSLQQMLEPDRSVGIRRPIPDVVTPTPTSSLPKVLIGLIIVLILAGGGLLLFKDKIFGATSTPTQQH
jgi:hypothetical protein